MRLGESIPDSSDEGAVNGADRDKVEIKKLILAQGKM